LVTAGIDLLYGCSDFATRDLSEQELAPRRKCVILANDVTDDLAL
jgi:hypothetical protein